MELINCPICKKEFDLKTGIYQHLEKMGKAFDYYECPFCGSIFIDPNIIKQMDQGEPLITYEEDYWSMEDNAAINRCYGAGLARVAETFYYAKHPINHFLDIGTGTGLILDALSLFLPENAGRFYGVEKFPPAPKSLFHGLLHKLTPPPRRFA